MFNRRQLLLEAYKFLDLLIMAGCFVLATWVTLHYYNGAPSFEQFVSMRIKVQNLALFIGFLYLWRILFTAIGLYESMRLSTRSVEIKNIFKATSVGTLALLVASTVFNIHMMAPTFIAVFWVTNTAMTISSRLFIRSALTWIRLQGRNLRHMVIVGTNQRAVRFAREIESKPELGYRLLGYVENGWRGNEYFRGNGDNVVSDFDGFPSFIREKAVDEVVFYLPVKSFYEQISAMAMLCQNRGSRSDTLPTYSP
jgi:FlaA1/EpsC-like NDP-sugar epimerase